MFVGLYLGARIDGMRSTDRLTTTAAARRAGPIFIQAPRCSTAAVALGSALQRPTNSPEAAMEKGSTQDHHSVEALSSTAAARPAAARLLCGLALLRRQPLQEGRIDPLDGERFRQTQTQE
jgi:hypothetical protein